MILTGPWEPHGLLRQRFWGTLVPKSELSLPLPPGWGKMPMRGRCLTQELAQNCICGSQWVEAGEDKRVPVTFHLLDIWPDPSLSSTGPAPCLMSLCRTQGLTLLRVLGLRVYGKGL